MTWLTSLLPGFFPAIANFMVGLDQVVLRQREHLSFREPGRVTRPLPSDDPQKNYLLPSLGNLA
jgi:hypothetical protein